ncbi:hypothetical protein ACGFWE_30375 [Streptomyces sp. NPDC048523]|uniref:hypothetical protein n=1 Tax=unclassified Streptomyces TaxID=2593676 RepID=UPI00331F7D6A
MDWSVVVLGCLLVLLGFGCRWWVQTKIRQGASLRQEVRLSLIPLLIGLGLVVGKSPSLVGAPFAVVMTADSMSFVLMVAATLISVVAATRRGGSGRSAE